MRYIETIFKYFDKIIISSKSTKDIEKKHLQSMLELHNEPMCLIVGM